MYSIEKSIGYNERDAVNYIKKPNIFIEKNKDFEKTYIVKNKEKVFIGNNISYISGFNRGVSIVRKYDKAVLIDYNGNIITDDIFVNIEGPVNGLYIGEYMDSHKVIINNSGKIISDKYDRIESFIDKYFLVVSNGSVGLIDNTGKELIMPIKKSVIDRMKKDYNKSNNQDNKFNNNINKDIKVISNINNSNFYIVYDSSSTYGYKIMDNKLNCTTESYYDLRVEDNNLIINNNKSIPISKLRLSYNIKVSDGRVDINRTFNKEEDMNNFYRQLSKIVKANNDSIESIREEVRKENRLFEDTDITRINGIEKNNNYIFRCTLDRLDREQAKRYKK